MSDHQNKKKLPVKIPFIFRLIHFLFPILEKIATPLANKLTVFAFFHPMRFKPPVKEEEAYDQAEKSEIISSNRKVQVYKWGDGTKKVLMTHGWSGRGTQFREFIKPFINSGYCIISYDGPAHGRSGGRKTNVTEFHDVIRQLEINYGPFICLIGHSFGGVANLYALTQGIKTRRMIMIATPTIADDIINESVNKLNGSHERAEYLKNYILKRFGIPFENVSVLKLIENVHDLPVLLIHDLNDKEVSIVHPESLIAKYPLAKLIRTEGLGHIRILKNQDVINHCLEFIDAADHPD